MKKKGQRQSGKKKKKDRHICPEKAGVETQI
jgi:hypothetical protein